MDCFVGLILLLSLFKIGDDRIVVDTFDMIEVNHYHNEWGVQIWSQVILWDWCDLDHKFHCHKWIMMKDSYVKTEQGKAKWEEARREIENSLETFERRKQWMWASEYRGDFVCGKFYPKKNWTTGFYEIKYRDGKIDRLIKAKVFRETYTQYDPEVKDRREYPTKKRRGLAKQTEKSVEELIEELSE